MRILGALVWWLCQLLPLVYRVYYCDERGRIHFAVWRMWFGRCFAVTDVVVDPYANSGNAKVNALLELWARTNLGTCDDCKQCVR